MFERPGLAVAVAILLGGCGGIRDTAFTPRFPGAPRAPTSPERIKIHAGVERPVCAYDVIGTVFAAGTDKLRDAAASAGGDGIYDTQCRIEKATVGFAQARSDCSGRVYVCRDGAR